MKATPKRKRTVSKSVKPPSKKLTSREAEPASVGNSRSTLTMSQEDQDKLMKHPDMFAHSMGWLMGLVRAPGGDLPTKNAQDFAYEAFIGFIPDGPGEIMLCQQMIAAYELAMSMLSRSKRADNLSVMQECGLLGVKMMGAYERLSQTLMKQRRPQQTVRVEHVTIVGGQTVVGNVSQPALSSPQNPDEIAIEAAARKIVEGAR
jgi:hypothetical protein